VEEGRGKREDGRGKRGEGRRTKKNLKLETLNLKP
jgi:hypothetical protein